jgi:NitT/TauT family transport system substrate-binding protein
VAAKVIRAVVKTQAALKEDLSLAVAVGAKVFPARAAALIGAVVERDLPYYEPSISEAFVGTMNQFSREIGLLVGDPSYDDIVATQLSKHWRLAPS